MKKKLYLDDIRIPYDPDFIVVKTHLELVETVKKYGLDKFELISLDHDLGFQAMKEYYRYMEWGDDLSYDNIEEYTGYDSAKFLVELSMDTNIDLPQIIVHSANPIGSENIIKLINNYLKSNGKKETCIRGEFPHYLNVT